MSSLSVRTWVVCLAVVWSGADRPAFAQQANGPYAGAFGAQADANRTQGLDLQASLFGAFNRDAFPESITPRDLGIRETGVSGYLAGSLNYQRRGDRAQFQLAGGGMTQKYASSDHLGASAYYGATALTSKVAPRLFLDVRARAAYSPFFELATVLDAGSGASNALGAGFSMAAVVDPNVNLNGSVGLTSRLTKRTSLFATIDGSDWRMLDRPQDNLRTWGGHAGMRHQIGRGVGVHVEYGREQNEYATAGGPPYVSETMDAGIDYGDTLKFSRRVALSFSTATGAVRYLGETHYRLNGAARLTRALGRTWSTWIGFNRTSEFSVGFREPLLADAVNAGLSGLVSWRVQWATGVGYTRGTIGFGSSEFSTYSGTSRVDFALARRVTLFGQYVYYHHQIPPGSSPLNLVPSFSRQVVMFGLGLSQPLVNSVRAPKAPQEP